MLGAIAEGQTRIEGFLQGEDTLATMAAFHAMGVEIDYQDERVTINGVGLHGLKAPKIPLDLGNSGTATRLLAGLLAGQSFDAEITGDASLRRRPMRRIVDPLQQMGADITCSEQGTLPLTIHGGQGLRAIDYALPVASAQLKSSLLLAGLYASGTTCITEPAVTRDHTERMLREFGCELQRKRNRICIRGGSQIKACHVHVPADISSAAFFLVGASIATGSDLILERVGINPTRDAIIPILQQMGADISLANQQVVSGEPVADIRVRSASLHGIDIPQDKVAIAIDEFPAIMIAAACARGRTRLHGASELRIKESDRIQAIASGLEVLGIDVRTHEDGMEVRGGVVSGGTVDSFTDHRIAMAFSMAGLAASGPVHILNCGNVATSFPGFPNLASAAGLQISISGESHGG